MPVGFEMRWLFIMRGVGKDRHVVKLGFGPIDGYWSKPRVNNLGGMVCYKRKFFW